MHPGLTKPACRTHSTAVCCEALEKVSLLVDRDWRISRLLHVAKQGIFASIYKDYSPKEWFFRQDTFYQRPFLATGANSFFQPLL